MNLLLPCEVGLFEATSSGRWIEMLNKSKNLAASAMVPSSNIMPLQEIPYPPDPFAIFGMFSAILLRISDGYHCLLSNNELAASQQEYIPWRTYATDSRAKLTASLVVRVMEIYGDLLKKINPDLHSHVAQHVYNAECRHSHL